MKFYSFFTVFVVTILSSSLSFADPRFLDPVAEADYIARLGLSDPFSHDRYNMLLLGYDASNSQTVLTSRTDIMMLISFDRVNRSIDILSVGRDFKPGAVCGTGSQLINGLANTMGRQAFILCLRQALTTFLANTPFAEEFELDGDLIPIHSIHEAQRGEDADSSAVGDLFEGIFYSPINAAILALSYTDSWDTMVGIAGRYKVIFNGLKRRDYPAGSYQRAFNNAKFVADSMSWAARAVQSSTAEGYNFLSSGMMDSVDDVVRGSVSLETLNHLLSFYPTGRATAFDNMFRYAGFIPNPNPEKGATRRDEFTGADPVSPVRVIQFGDRWDAYAVYEDGVLSRVQGHFIKALRVRPVLQKPGEAVPVCPECHIKPDLPAGSWGTRDGRGLR